MMIQTRQAIIDMDTFKYYEEYFEDKYKIIQTLEENGEVDVTIIRLWPRDSDRFNVIMIIGEFVGYIDYLYMNSAVGITVSSNFFDDDDENEETSAEDVLEMIPDGHKITKKLKKWLIENDDE
jgi:hypothetical protein